MANITGTTRNESLYGTRENDIIDGKGGSDLLRDLYGSNDTYVFNYGYGQPNITDNGGNDTVLFGQGITAQDMKFYLTSTGFLMARIKDSTDKVEVTNWPNSAYQLENWVFQDGSYLSSTQINNAIDYNTKVIIASTDADSIRVSGGSNLVYLLQGDDIFTSTAGNNMIEASSGNDLIYNYGSGNDEIYMSTGIDYTEDRGGNDRYIYNKGDGTDIIYDFAGNDTVKFGRSITADNLVFKTSGKNLVVSFKNLSADSLTIKNWIINPVYQTEIFELWDGTQITSQSVNSQISSQNGSSQGSIPADSAFVVPLPTMTGTDGYNSFSGQYGDDIYYLKKGNDRVMDYAGNDTYIFNKGDGQDNITDQAGSDRIIFGSGISKNDVAFNIDPNNSQNLLISFNNSTDIININKWFRSSNYQIEKVLFSDGSGFTNADINNIINNVTNPPVEKPINITGSVNSENLAGNEMDNVFSGGKGNDVLTDPSGNDTYNFNKGDGQDTIIDKGSDDSIKFGAGIYQNDVSFGKSGNDLIANLINSADKITIKDWYLSTQNKIEHFNFANGSSLNYLEVEGKVLDNWGSFGYAPTYTGTDGYNSLSGQYGNDIYYLKRTADRVMDYAGDDIYLFNKGDGQDNITDQGGNDSIVLGLGLSKSDIIFQVDPNNSQNLLINVAGQSNSININKWFKSSVYQIEQIKFLEDGSYLTSSDINGILQQTVSYAVNNSQALLSAAYNQNSQDITLVISH